VCSSDLKHQPRACYAQLAGDAFANAAGGAGDENDFVLKGHEGCLLSVGML
jgi:hypothetical protein